jgi:SAM-dependent methyltransferase
MGTPPGPEQAGQDMRAHLRRAGWRGHLYNVLVPSVRRLNGALRTASARSHQFQYKVEGFLRPSAEWFDHEIDVYWQWVARQRSMFLERGVLNTLAIRSGAQVLELCCGDGFNAHRFYAERAEHVLAVDHDPTALAHARRFHARPNLEYRACDVLQGLPEGAFDNIVWDSAMHHFSLSEVAMILASAHRSLTPEGVLSGYTVIDPEEDYAYARLRFESSDALGDLLAGEFAHVAVLETTDASRRNVYFFAADVAARLEFAPGLRRPAGTQRSHTRTDSQSQPAA